MQENTDVAVPTQGPSLSAMLGRNVRALRLSRALPKYALAKMAGISRPTLNKIEHGTANARLSTIELLADALSVSPFDLISDRIIL